jgi:hypothetical protein
MEAGLFFDTKKVSFKSVYKTYLKFIFQKTNYLFLFKIVLSYLKNKNNY